MYGISLGRNRIVVILISIYMSIALINTFPFANYQVAEIQVGDSFVLRITIFLALVLLIFFFLSRSAIRSALRFPKKDDSAWGQVFLFSILHVGLLVSVIVSFLPTSAVEQLAPLTRSIFVSPISQFLWVLMPILAMVFVRKKEERKA